MIFLGHLDAMVPENRNLASLTGQRVCQGTTPLGSELELGAYAYPTEENSSRSINLFVTLSLSL